MTTTSVPALRRALVAAGFTPVPLFGKAPPSYGKNSAKKGLGGWQNLEGVTPEQIDSWSRDWPDASNTGILTKYAPALDIDILDERAADAIEKLVHERYDEERGYFLVRTGRWPKRAILMRTDEPFSKISTSFVAPGAATGADPERIELLADGQQLACFGIHPATLQPYRWQGGDPSKIAREKLPYIREAEARELVEAIVELLINEFGYERAAARPSGNGPDGPPADWGWLTEQIHQGRELHDSTVSLAAKLIASGMADGAAVNFLRGLYDKSIAPKDRRFRERYDDIPRAVTSARKKFAPPPEPPPPPPPPKAPPLFDPWERYIVPSFPFDILPTIAKDFVNDRSTVIGCDGSALAMAVLATFSGALHHRFTIKMMRNGDWCEHPRLWVLLVADPSQLKTPIINAATAPLTHYETHLRVKYEHDLRDYEMGKSAAKEAGEKTALREPPKPPRYVVWDTTVEKLGELLLRSDKGILVKSDEISGWIGSMERYSAGRSDRGFWLCAYDGGPHNIDRIKRGEMHARNLSVSLLGGIQPARLAEIQGLTSDGLLQRFLPVMMIAAHLPQDRASDGENYDKLVREMIFAEPARLIMTDDAVVVMAKLQEHLFNLEQASRGLASGFQSFVGKLRGLAGSVALILHMARDPQTRRFRHVEAGTIENTRRLVVDFLLPHAFEFYRTSEPEGDRLRRLASWILTSGQQRVLASDLTTNIRDFRGLTLVEVNERVSPLVACGWLAPTDKTPVCRAWQVAPHVHTQFAERTKLEKERKAALAALIDSPRKERA